MKQFTISAEVKDLAESVIKEHKLAYLKDVNIEYLTVLPNISTSVIGKCIKASNELKFFTKKDYIIEVSGEIWENLDEETRKILLLHELLHISLKTNKKGDIVYGISDHDVKDFKRVIKHYGAEWGEKIKACVASIYDMSPEESENITV